VRQGTAGFGSAASTVADLNLLRFQGGAHGGDGSIADQQAEGTETDRENGADHGVGCG
jgi:hypothetical protein